MQRGLMIHTLKSLHMYLSLPLMFKLWVNLSLHSFHIHLTCLLQKVMKFSRRLARKMSCMRADDVQVPTHGGHRGEGSTSRQMPAIATPSASLARTRDPHDDNDDDDNDPPYDQHELTGSQLVDAPPPTQTQVSGTYQPKRPRNMFNQILETLMIMPRLSYGTCRVRPNAHAEVKGETFEVVATVTAPTLELPMSFLPRLAALVVQPSPSRPLDCACVLRGLYGLYASSCACVHSMDCIMDICELCA